MHCRYYEGNCSMAGGFTTMVDVRERSLTLFPGQFYPLHPIYFFDGNKMFCLSLGSFKMLVWDRDPPLGSSHGVESPWKQLPEPPFQCYDVTSYVMQPRSRAFVVSTKIDDTKATFAFDTVELSWKRLGSWALPFDGRGHFDQHLNAFVGLSKEPNTLGQLYFCYVPIDGTSPRLSSKLGEEKLFSQDPAERHVSATLIYIGTGESKPSKFCLVQCVFIEGDSSAGQELKEKGRFLYRLTIFCLYPDCIGGLTTGNSQRVQYYEVPEGTSQRFLAEDPMAFGM
ncbi:hypothetical protein CFC21_098293 [Triticum aestivum]|uniref:F-box associated domain-containing protein n=2 Tax=Triticum aestivum TaxID=4565 RepID=A0A9R1LWS1_WHEAT|nr:hypothetical protein CFC21_098293 [Triticum aestivum]